MGSANDKARKLIATKKKMRSGCVDNTRTIAYTAAAPRKSPATPDSRGSAAKGGKSLGTPVTSLALCRIFTTDFGQNREAEVDPRGYAAARDAITVRHHAFARSLDIHRLQYRENTPNALLICNP